MWLEFGSVIDPSFGRISQFVDSRSRSAISYNPRWSMIRSSSSISSEAEQLIVDRAWNHLATGTEASGRTFMHERSPDQDFATSVADGSPTAVVSCPSNSVPSAAIPQPVEARQSGGAMWIVGLIFLLTIVGFSLAATPASAQSSSPNRSSEVRAANAANGGNPVNAVDPKVPVPAIAPDAEFPVPEGLNGLDVDRMLSPQGMPSTLKIMALLTVISLAPSILMMTTCFVRFVIVLGLLRQALGTQQLPPNQIIVSLCMFLTFTVMAPVWQQAYEQGVRPYTDPVAGQPVPTLEVAFQNTMQPLRLFMLEQIQRTNNTEGIFLLMEYQQPAADSLSLDEINYDDVPLSVLLPAYMLSELKTSFLIGFQIYLPFVIIDMVIASVLISMGMMMLPPVLISLPFKLLLFVMIDGWFLTVGMMLESVSAGGG